MKQLNPKKSLQSKNGKESEEPTKKSIEPTKKPKPGQEILTD